MTVAKPKPYSKRKATKPVLKGDAEIKPEISSELKPVKPEPKPEPKMQTKGGKDYDIVPGPFGYRIQFTSGGQIPLELTGLFTSRNVAIESIKRYEAKRG